MVSIAAVTSVGDYAARDAVLRAAVHNYNTALVRMRLHWIKTRLTAPAFREARSLTAALMCCIATRMVVFDQRAVR